ncbi:MAG: FAD-dependent oxidoreductase [Desulfobacteraceae bacterium]|jgi:thioredoxin reductase
MANERPISLDVAIVGGGPAGITAGLELSKSSNLRMALFEGDTELGGMPRSCHVFFGMRDQRRLYTGPAYARILNRLIRKTDVDIHTESRVLNIIPGNLGEPHQINVLSPQGLTSYESRFLLLATGCFESSRSARHIPGTRPAGILTTGTLQDLVNLRLLKPGNRALIIGSEHVALSSVLTLRRAEISIAGIVEEDPELQTYPWAAHATGRFFNFPIYKDTSVKAILGDKRVEGVQLVKQKDQEFFQVECDTVIITGKFRPDSSLIDNTPIEQDPSSLGPVVDMNLMTSVPNIFGAGNVLRGANMHDLCALEGKMAARSILKKLGSRRTQTDKSIRLRAESPLRHVVPQKIEPGQIRKRLFSKLFPWPAFQVERTLRNPIIEAWSGKEEIWEGSFRKLIANTRIPIPVEKFDWNRCDPEKEITLEVKGAHN